MKKFSLHPTEMRIGLNAGAGSAKNNLLVWIVVIAAVAGLIYLIVKKYRNEKAKQ
jgi:hypothetical protein